MAQLEAEGAFNGQARVHEDRRRHAFVQCRIPERRTGYDRRVLAASWIERVLHDISVRDELALTLLAAVVAANVVDALYTGTLLQRGATEANGFLSYLMMSMGTSAALGVKMLLCLAIAGAVWALRRYRPAAILLVAWLGAFTLLIVYQTALFAVR